MRDSVRLEIIKALKAQAQTITIANGFNTDAGHQCEIGRKHWEPEDKPIISISPGVGTIANEYGENIHTLPVRVDLLDKFELTDSAYEKVEHILADLTEVMADTMDTITNGLADDLVLTESGVDNYPDEQAAYVGCHVSFNIIYRTRRGNPYEQK